jgi:hypothetical protein
LLETKQQGVELRKTSNEQKVNIQQKTQTNLSMKTKKKNGQDQSLQMHMGNNFPSNKKLKRTNDLNF